MNERAAWEHKVQEVAGKVEEELKRVVAYINDEVVPDVRRNGTVALRAAAVELEKLAKKMDDRRAAPPPPPPGGVTRE